MRLLVSGWRDVPHSYSLVNQYQLLALRGVAPDLDLRHRDLPYLFDYWQPQPALIAPAAASVLAGIPDPDPTWLPHLELHYGHPPDLQSRDWPYACFTTVEWGIVRRQVLSRLNVTALGDLACGSDIDLITPSRFSRQGLIASGWPPERIRVISHGVATEVFRPAATDGRRDLRHRLGLDDGLWLLSVGAMTGNKGIGQMLLAVARLLETHPQVGLMLKGSDDLYNSRRRLEALLRERLPSDSVQRLLPRLRYWGGTLSASEMACLYQAADGYLSAYRAEAFNLPVLEAMACGLPVICTAGGPTDEFTEPEFCLRIASERVRHEQDGEVFYSLQPDGEHLQQHLCTWAEDAAWRHQAGIRAHTAAQAYDWSAIACQLLDYCRQRR